MSDDRADGGPAFPHPGSVGEVGNVLVYPELGMTLRDYFAAQAMIAIGSMMGGGNEFSISWSELAKRSYNAADAMLAARKPTP